MDAWWRSGVIYQVYPRSFQDSNGDGVGDLAGLAERLDHLVDLGVDAVWVSPFYPSPMKDFGYDVADYCDVDPLFGALSDFDALLQAAHARGLKLLIDFVPNHTSEQHPWFQQSRASRTSPLRDWYIGRDPAPGGGRPNNWLSVFGGSAWRLDATTGQYVLHSFLPEQPDLNWRNPAVDNAMFDVLRFWLDRGVDGFRVDVLWHLIKDDQFRDNPPNPAFDPVTQPPHVILDPVYSADRPETLDIVRRMRALLDSYSGQRVMVGETYLPISRLVAYYGDRLDGAHLPFNFKLLQTPWNARAIDDIIGRYEAALPAGAQPNWVLGNHDNPRVATRWGAGAARAAMLLLLTLRGTPTLYYGDELAMADVEIPQARTQDPRAFSQPGLGRDPERTPMPWSNAANGGFSTAEPWLPLNADWAERNVAAQATDTTSMLVLTRQLLALRRSEGALHAGAYESLGVQGEVLLYARSMADSRLVVAINMSDQPGEAKLPLGGELVLSTRERPRVRVEGRLELSPGEGLIIRAA